MSSDANQIKKAFHEEHGSPILEMLSQHAKRELSGFHMPGHNRGAGLDLWLQSVGLYDTTELPGTDSLHNANGAIAASEDIAAKTFGAFRSFFLVNGSSCGIFAMIYAATMPGDSLLVSRDCHLSVLNAMAVCQVHPIFLMPDIRPDQLPLGVTASAVESAIIKYPEAKAVLLTRPNYYGVCADISQLAITLKEAGKLLLVDEAHGAHLGFHEALPSSAISQGADVVVQSLHKTLPALTQTAVLHIPSGSFFSEAPHLVRLTQAIAMFQTTSPSYLLMCSMEATISRYAREGKQLLEGQFEQVRWFIEQLRLIPSIQVVTVRQEGFSKDDTRIVLDTSATRRSGWSLERHLRTNGVYVEMADAFRVVLITTPFHTQADYALLLDALKRLKDETEAENLIAVSHPNRLPQVAIPMSIAMKMPSVSIPLTETCGMVLAEKLVPYPPGIPVLLPGEVMDSALLVYLQALQAAGATINGLVDGHVQIITQTESNIDCLSASQRL